MPHWPFPLICAFTLTLIGFYFLYKNKSGLAVFSLFVAGLVIRLWAAHLDPFLHEWDERFHALVARNMMDTPFKPMLRKSPLDNVMVMEWCCSNIWLHKQPLFLWQMALSMKIFGVSEFAIRYPAALQGALLVPMIYRIAHHLLKNRYAGFIAALFVCFSYYNLELISGAYAIDHNDAVFVFYITASIWAYVEYMHSSRKLKWAIIVGLFTGGAILTKWLTGMLVYSAWGISILISLHTREGRSEIKYILLSVVTAVAVFLPWQLYTWRAFPIYARHEYEYNMKHLTENLEETHSDIGYYFNHLDVYFGYGLWIALIIGVLLLLFRYRNRLTFSLVFYFLFTFSFFSLVKSQGEAFVYIVVPIGFILIAASTVLLLQHKYLRYLLVLLVTLGLNNVFNYRSIAKTHDPADERRQAMVENEKKYKALSGKIPEGYKLVLNAKEFQDINAMFYNNDLNVFAWSLTDPLIDSLMSKNVPIAAFQSRNGYPVNEKLYSYHRYFQINEDLK